MQMRTLGRTGVQVSPLCLGAMMFGAWGNTDHDDSIRIIHRALDAGINFIDTADVYSAGESEEIVGKALAGGRRDNVVLATKAHGVMGKDPNQQGNSRRWLIARGGGQPTRLGTDYIDLYQIHRPSPDTDIDETLGALTDLVRAGKVRYIGSSTFPAHEIVEAQYVARATGAASGSCAEQPPYSMLFRGIERDMLPVAQSLRDGSDPVEPAGRRLAVRQVAQGRRRSHQPAERDAPGALRPIATREPTQARRRRCPRSLADDSGISLVHLAIAFVLQHPAVTAPIIGPRTMDQLETQLGAAEVALSGDILDRIDEIVPPGLNIAMGDYGYQPPSLTDVSLRRR